MTKKVKVFVGGHCGPCDEIKSLLQDGKYTIDGDSGGKVEIIDIETETGFPSVLEHQLVGVPAAVDEQGKQCKILVDEENSLVILECDERED